MDRYGRRFYDEDGSDVKEQIQNKIKEVKQMGANFGKKKAMGVFILIMVFVLLGIGSTIVGSNKAGHIIVKQIPWIGTLNAIFTEGIYWRLCGDTFDYPVSEHFYFSKHGDEGKTSDESVEVTFRNGSVGRVSGSLRFTYPQNEPQMLTLHRRYTSNIGVKNDLVRTEARKLISMTASLMSPEAAMTQKGLYYQMLQDQIENGQYETVAAIEEYIDPVTKEKKFRDVVEVAKKKDGEIIRLDNPFKDWGIKVDQLVIQDIDPDKVTKEMIEKRRDAEMKVMVAKADTERARQEQQRVIAEGEKAVAEKEYAALQEKKLAVVAAQREKEVAETNANKEKAVAVTTAQKEVEVNAKKYEAAEWDRKTAEQIKMASIERGKGEAEARRLIMEADGALSLKLQTLKDIMMYGYDAFAKRNVAQIEFNNGGTTGGTGDSSVLNLMQLLLAKTTKDLALDMSMETTKPSKNK